MALPLATVLGGEGHRSTDIITALTAWSGVPLFCWYAADLTSFALPTMVRLESSMGANTQDLTFVDSHNVGARCVALYWCLPTISSASTPTIRVAGAESRPKYQYVFEVAADSTTPIITASITKASSGTTTHPAVTSGNNLLAHYMLGGGSTSPGASHTASSPWTGFGASDSTNGGGQGKGMGGQLVASNGDLTDNPTWDTIDSSYFVSLAVEIQETAGGAAISALENEYQLRFRRKPGARIFVPDEVTGNIITPTIGALPNEPWPRRKIVPPKGLPLEAQSLTGFGLPSPLQDGPQGSRRLFRARPQGTPETLIVLKVEEFEAPDDVPAPRRVVAPRKPATEPALGASPDTSRATGEPMVLHWKRPKTRFPVEQAPLTPYVTVLLNVLEDVTYRRGPATRGFVEVLPAVGTMFPVVTQPAVADDLPPRKGRKHRTRMSLWWPEPDLGDRIIPAFFPEPFPESVPVHTFAVDSESHRFKVHVPEHGFAQHVIVFRRPIKLF